MRDRLNLTLPVELIARINELADRERNCPRSAIVEAAVSSFLSPDHADVRGSLRTPARQAVPADPADERDLGVTAETLALYVRFWLSITPPVPSDAHAAAQAKGRERFDGFVETLGKRLQKGQSFLREIPDDVPGAAPAKRPNSPLPLRPSTIVPRCKPISIIARRTDAASKIKWRHTNIKCPIRLSKIPLRSLFLTHPDF